MEWLESRQLKIAPPKRTKKITGTRFATILGLNPWSTPFEMWLAITKTYEIPFEDTLLRPTVTVRIISNPLGAISSPKANILAVCGTTSALMRTAL